MMMDYILYIFLENYTAVDISFKCCELYVMVKLEKMDVDIWFLFAK